MVVLPKGIAFPHGKCVTLQLPQEMVAHCFQTWLYCSWDIWLFLKANVLPINHLGKMIMLPWEMVWPKHLFLMDLLFLKEIGYHL
jgi:hypothetical protein